MADLKTQKKKKKKITNTCGNNLMMKLIKIKIQI